MPTDTAVAIIKEFTKSPSRQKKISTEAIWKAFPKQQRGMLESTVREVIRKEQFNDMTDWQINRSGRQATYTRRTNKVLALLHKGFNEISERGAVGMYSLEFGYYMRDHTLGTTAFAYANSLAEAEKIFETMYKPFCDEKWWRHVNIQFLDFADKAEALATLSKIDSNYSRQTKSLSERIGKLQEEIGTVEEQIKRVETMKDASVQLLLMTIDE